MCCSVVFDVTLRLLVINISSSSPANTAAYYQTICHNLRAVAVVHRRPCYNTWPVAALTTSIQAIYRLRIANSAYPTCIRRPR